MKMKKTPHRLILASGSKARREMLESAGLEFSVIPADIDERAIEKSFTGNNPAELAAELAKAKALHIAGQEENKNALVIGSDQILEFEGKILSKARTKEEALEKIRMLKGKTHRLISAFAIVKGPETLCHGVQEAHLTMHDFDEAFLQAYTEKAGSGLTSAVGAYELEGPGAWLFDKIEGDYFTILGMPLLPVLKFLRPYEN